MEIKLRNKNSGEMKNFKSGAVMAAASWNFFLNENPLFEINYYSRVSCRSLSQVWHSLVHFFLHTSCTKHDILYLANADLKFKLFQ